MPKMFTPESSVKAKEQTDFQRSFYVRRHADDDHWVELARRANVNLPMFYVRPSDAGVKGTLRKLNLDWNLYLEAYGWATTAEFEKLNPTFSMRPLTGLILELWDEQTRLTESCAAAASAREMQPGSAKPKRKQYPRGVAKAKRTALKPV